MRRGQIEHSCYPVHLRKFLRTTYPVAASVDPDQYQDRQVIESLIIITFQ